MHSIIKSSLHTKENLRKNKFLVMLLKYRHKIYDMYNFVSKFLLIIIHLNISIKYEKINLKR
jgi:hypothetical protein